MATRAFRIMEGTKGIESHDDLLSASRAFWIMTAQEIQNGRSGDRYTLHGGVLLHWVNCDLPNWALVALKGEG